MKPKGFSVDHAKYLVVYPNDSGGTCVRRLRSEEGVSQNLHTLIDICKIKNDCIEIYKVKDAVHPTSSSDWSHKPSEPKSIFLLYTLENEEESSFKLLRGVFTDLVKMSTAIYHLKVNGVIVSEDNVEIVQIVENEYLSNGDSY